MNTTVTLIVWQKTDKGTRKLEYNNIKSHQEASKLARHMFSGMRTKIVDKQQRRFPVKMKSYSDMMSDRFAY